MAATKQYPVYSVYVISDSTKYNLTPALTYIERSDPKGQISQRVRLQLLNVKLNGTSLASILQPRCRVFVYADDGIKNEEVFRGYLWTRYYKSSLSERDLKYTCYDNLIYLQNSEDSLYFASGKATKDIVSSICKSWGVNLSYSYESIKHKKLPLRGNLYDILTEDILAPVRKKTKKKFVVLSDKDTMYVKPTGSNTTIYQFLGGKNIVSTGSGWTMDGMVTKVVILGPAGDDGKEPIDATVTGETSQYGTLQKIQDRDEDTSLSDAKLEAQYIIDENGKPKWEYEIVALDIPWVRKGDKVYVHAGDIVQKHLIVVEVDRTSDNKKSEMTLTLEEL